MKVASFRVARDLASRGLFSTGLKRSQSLPVRPSGASLRSRSLPAWPRHGFIHQAKLDTFSTLAQLKPNLATGDRNQN